jgi:hypothetical protein
LAAAKLLASATAAGRPISDIMHVMKPPIFSAMMVGKGDFE